MNNTPPTKKRKQKPREPNPIHIWTKADQEASVYATIERLKQKGYSLPLTSGGDLVVEPPTYDNKEKKT